MTTLPQGGASGVFSTEITTRIAQDTKVHFNLGQDAIVTTEDKVRIVLMTCLHKLENRKAWVAPAGILLTVIAAFATAKFNDFVLKAAVWEALFVFVGIACAIWLVFSLIRLQKAPTTDEIVAEINKSSASGGT